MLYYYLWHFTGLGTGEASLLLQTPFMIHLGTGQLKLLPFQLSSHDFSGLPGEVSYGANFISEPILQSCNCCKLQRPTGISPSILFKLKLTFCKDFNDPMGGGIGPVKYIYIFC